TIDRILLQNILYDVKLDELGNPQQAIAYAEGQVGIYSACYKLAMLVTIILQAYRYAAEPFFFNNSKNTDSKKMYIKVMNYIIAALCVVFLGVALNLQLFKYFIPNPAYWEGLKAVPLLLLANVFLGIYINQSIWYKLTGLTKYGAYIAIGGAFLTISINYLFIPMYGYMASAWATMLVYAAMMVASYIWGQQHYPINYNVRKFVLYFGSALAVFFALHYLALADGLLQFFVHNLAIALFVGGIVVVERGTK
ncbi:MAG TPA: oligosaccharide flippase family protein, partial [Taishania sp.]|nr:oligosaccharide flippase family protein [Taishania sp.]